MEKVSKVIGVLKNPKLVGLLTGVLLAVAILGGLACAFAGLIMLIWNVVAVAALTIAVPLTFLTALKGVGIIYGVVILLNLIRSAMQGYMQKVQTQVAMKMMRQFDEEMKKAQAQEEGGDFLKHFRMS